MIFWKKGKWHLCNEKVKYIQHGEEIIQYVRSEGKQWWLDFAEQWEHTEIIEFVPVEPTEKQLDRFEEILLLDLPDGYSGELSEYVEHGAFPEGFNHALRPLEVVKQQEDLEMSLSLSSMEIYNILGAMTMQNEIKQAEMQMGIIEMLSQLQGGN